MVNSSDRSLLRTFMILVVGAMLFALSGCSSDGDSGNPVDENEPDEEMEDPLMDPLDDDVPDVVSVSIDTNGQGTASPSQLTLNSGGVASVELNPDAGNEVKYVEGCAGTLTETGFDIGPVETSCSVFVQFGAVGNQLSIDVFGQGIVQLEGNTVCVSGETCRIAVSAGQSTQLQPIAASGWELSHWNGCSSLEDDVCIVSGGNDQTVAPIFARTGDPVLNEDVIILTDSQLDELQEIDDAGIIFSPVVPDIADFEIGKILVSTRGEGFARRISNVISIPQSPVLVQTRPATLTDIVEEGTLVWDGDLDSTEELEFVPADDVTVISVGPGRSLSRSVEIQTVIYDEDGDLDTTFDQLKLSGSLAAKFNPDLAFDFSFPAILEEARLAAGATLKAEMKLSYEIPILSALKFKKKKRLGTYFSPPIVVGPLVMAPRYDAFVEVGGSVDSKITVSTSFSLDGTLGLHYRRNDSRGWELLNSLSASADRPTLDNLELNINATVWTGIDSKFLLYGLAGPFVKSGPTIGYKRTYQLEGARQGCFEESAYVGASGEVGGVIDLIAWEIRAPTKKINIKSVQLSWIQDQGDNCDGELYGPPQNLTASLVQDNDVALFWEPPEGTPLVKYIIYRDNLVLESVWGTEYLDTTTNPLSEHCYTVVGFDSKGRSSVSSQQACASTGDKYDETPPSTPQSLSVTDKTVTSLELNWSPSIDNSGVVAYLVEAGDVLDRVTETSSTISQLLPNTEYCFQVVAIDPSGNRSTPSETVCAQTLGEDAGLWRMRIACEGREYALENQVDLQASSNGTVNFAGQGFDYSGVAIAYIVSGSYDFSEQNLDGRITYTFEGQNEVRIDLFEVNLAGDDTGDVSMNQIQVTGCDSIVRFDKLDTVSAMTPPPPIRSSHNHSLLMW